MRTTQADREDLRALIASYESTLVGNLPIGEGESIDRNMQAHDALVDKLLDTDVVARLLDDADKLDAIKVLVNDQPSDDENKDC